jgi:chromosome segregation ATPase
MEKHKLETQIATVELDGWKDKEIQLLRAEAGSEKLTEFRKRVGELEGNNGDLRSGFKKMEEALETIRPRHEELEKTTKVQEKRIQALEEKNSNLGTELEISNRKKVQIERDFEKLKTQMGLDEGNWGEYQKKIDALKKQNAELEINNSELVGKNMVDGRKLMEVLKIKSDWEVERDSLCTQIRLLKSNIGETQLSTEELERLNKRVSEETSKAEQYLAEKNSYYEDLKKYKTKCDKASAANAAMKLTFACVESEKNRVLADKTELQDKFDATEHELDDLKSKTEIERSGLDAQVKNFTKERDSLAEKNKKLAGKGAIKEKELSSANKKLADEISKLKDEFSDLGQEKAELVMNYNDIKNKFKDSVELADRQRDRAKEGDTKA